MFPAIIFFFIFAVVAIIFGIVNKKKEAVIVGSITIGIIILMIIALGVALDRM